MCHILLSGTGTHFVGTDRPLKSAAKVMIEGTYVTLFDNHIESEFILRRSLQREGIQEVAVGKHFIKCRFPFA